MQKKLKEIATIFTGQTFRSKVENNPEGKVWVIQMKDLNEDYTTLSGIPHAVNFNEISNNQLLQPGDVLFLARGNNNSAFEYNFNHPAVVVSLFFVIRLETSDVLPGYLTWFLNSQITQRYLITAREGASVSSIKKSILDELTIQILDKSKQELIAGIYNLSIRERQLTKELMNEKQTLIQSLSEIL